MNVLFALMEVNPPPPVVDWIAKQRMEMLFTAAPCQAEIMAGIAILPQGRRRANFAAAAEAMFADDFEHRVRPFDFAAALVYAEVYGDRRRTGRPVPTIDLMLAAIARAQRAGMVTRNVGDFAGCGIAVINPWSRPATVTR